jgi:hypothetical protein
MALHTNLPIYKVAYNLLSVATDYVVNMPRPVKHSIGSRLTDLCVEVVLLILRANCARDKAPHLNTLLERNEEAGLLLRLCQDKRFISKPQYAAAVELLDSVGKQAMGWKKKCTPA